MKSKPREEKKGILPILIVMAFIAIFSAILLMQKSPKEKEAALPVLGEVPDFSLTEKNGTTLRVDDLLGKVWIANFIFTRCSGICPIMTNKMQMLQETFKDNSEIRFVSFSVDPEFDKPEVLARYATRYKADPAKWFFLTGDKTVIHTLAVKHFHLGVDEQGQQPTHDPNANLMHSSKLVLIDKEGKIRGYYDTQEGASLDQITRDTKRLTEN
jgi:protein SCO1